MIGTIKHPLSNARWLQTPATVADTTGIGYLDALRSVAQKNKSDRLSKDEVSIRVLERWLSGKCDLHTAIVVDEALIIRLETEMADGTFKRRNEKPFKSLGRQVASDIRDLHGRAFQAKHPAIARPLVGNRTLPRYQRFLQLTQPTQIAMSWFEDAGVRPGKSGAPGTVLTVASRVLAISEAFQILSRLNVDGLEKITPEMVAGLIPTTGPDDPGYRRMIRSINNVGALFKSCVAKGLLPNDPTTGVAHNKFNNYAERDFLPPEELEKIRDLTTLDRGNDQHVIDRLVMSLLTDTALRRGELTSLSKSQVTKRDGGFAIRLLPGNQKMSNKVAVDLHVLYPETASLLEQYITKIRPRLAKIDADGFLVDGRGRSATALALVAACARESKRLGLQTYYNHGTPSPHDLRRTFAMCNASPLGLNLAPHELAERLRDGIDVVFKHYCTSNPLINAQRAKVYRKRAGGVVDEDKARDIMQTLKSWRIGDKLIRRLESEIAKLRTVAEQSAPADNQEGTWLSEEAAYQQLSKQWGAAPFWKKFRRYMRTQHAMRRASQYGKVMFKADVINALADGYVSVEMLKAKGVVNNAHLLDVLKSENALVIGRLALVRKDVAWGLLGLGGIRDSSSSSSAAVQTSATNRSKHPAILRNMTRSKVA